MRKRKNQSYPSFFKECFGYLILRFLDYCLTIDERKKMRIEQRKIVRDLRHNLDKS